MQRVSLPQLLSMPRKSRDAKRRRPLMNSNERRNEFSPLPVSPLFSPSPLSRNIQERVESDRRVSSRQPPASQAGLARDGRTGPIITAAESAVPWKPLLRHASVGNKGGRRDLTLERSTHLLSSGRVRTHPVRLRYPHARRHARVPESAKSSARSARERKKAE